MIPKFYEGISCFIVEKGSEGLSFGSKEEKVRTSLFISR